MSVTLEVLVTSDTTTVLNVTSSVPGTVNVYRRIGSASASVPRAILNLTDGRASLTDTPPQKVLVTYYVVNEAGETSRDRTAVLPAHYSLVRPTLNADVQLGDLVLNTVDDDGTVWVMSDLEGWWSPPTALIPSSLRGPNEDGDYDSDGRYDTRVLKFEGVFLPETPESLAPARDRLVRAIDAVRRTQRLALYGDEPKFLSVRLTGLPLISTVRSTGLTEFSVSLRASDPIKKSIEETVSVLTGGAGQGGRTYSRTYPRTYGTVAAPSLRTIVNAGNYPSYPRIVIYGPVQAPRVENVTTGEYIGFNLNLTADQYLEIDMREKTALLNGAVSRRSSFSSGSRWWQLRAGNNEVRFSSFTSQAGSHVDIYSRSSWIG